MLIEKFVEYYNTNKGLGHTSLLVKVCTLYCAVLICNNNRQAEELAKQFGINTQSPSASLRGIRGKPVLIDPSALCIMYNEVDNFINLLVKEKDKLQNTVNKLLNINHRLTLDYESRNIEITKLKTDHEIQLLEIEASYNAKISKLEKTINRYKPKKRTKSEK